jgi:hypothetical protein
MKKKIQNKNTLQESLRRFGHMLAMREQRGDNSTEYKKKQAMHESMLRKLYNQS